ncbi:MAG: sugar ABC transporter ATP-binding protein [Rhizobiaceae bacterium]|nr:MAG: sugar ABC transporter ATP-binding protein [Rhizobiaceae bacterium]
MSRTALWELRNISKRFGAILANDDVSVTLDRGEIHALLGENGSGKSTLIKVLSGAYQPDSGSILNDGRAVELPSPQAARSLGIATVFQEFSLVPHLSVAENILIGRWAGSPLRIDWDGMRLAASAILAEMQIDLPVDKPVAALSVAGQQLVEIAKAVAQDARMLILDEPTTALASREAESLFALLRRLRDGGSAILYVSHRLEEVVRLADKATVLRNGRVASSATETPLEVSAIVDRMVGQAITTHYPKQRNVTGEPLLDVEGVASDSGVRDVSLVLHRGEVLGLGGALGSGRTEIVRALFGADPLKAGVIRVKGRSVRFSSPADAIAAGIALLTENRKTDGLFFNFDICSNMTIAHLDAFRHGPQLDLARERRDAGNLIRRLGIYPEDAAYPVENLSGGNQQKVIIGRWLYAGAEIFLLDEPTQGIDIGAKVAVYELVNELTRAGAGVILISSDDEELLALSDRIAIVRGGRIVRIDIASAITKSDLMHKSAQEAA